MSEFKFDINEFTGKQTAKQMGDRIKFDVLLNMLIEKGIVSEEEFNKLVQDTLEHSSLQYASDALGVTVEEFEKLLGK